MTPNLLRAQVISERSAWIRDMLEKLKSLPLASFESFIADSGILPRPNRICAGPWRRCWIWGGIFWPKDSAWPLRSTRKLPKDSPNREY